MCEYCDKYHSGKGLVMGKGILIKGNKMLTDCRITISPNEEPAMIIYSQGFSRGCINIRFCPMCGEKLSGIEREKKDMLSAHDARTATQNNINNCTTKELAKLEEQISSAIANGEFSISNSGCLQLKTRQRLKKLGYKVTTGSQYNESYYCISWK